MAQLQAAQAHVQQAQADGEQDQDNDPFGSPDGQSRKPRKLRKPNDVARCQANCGRELSDAKLYLRRYSVCEPHFKAEWVTLGGGRFRFCQQCNKFQPLDNFAGNRRSCKARSEDRNLRRRKQRTDERQAAEDDSDPGGRAGLLKVQGGQLAVPARVALADNGMLRQLADPNDPLAQLQYAQQVSQFLVAGAGGLAPAPAAAVQLPPGLDLAALMGGDFSAFGSPNANALSLLTAAAANGAGLARTTAAPAPDPSGGAAVLQQLQLAQLLAKGAAAGGGGAAAAGGALGSLGAAAANGLAAALGAAGLNLSGVGSPTAAGAAGSGSLAHQLIMSTAAAGSSGSAGVAAPDSTLDLQSLVAQQLAQQLAAQQAATQSPQQPGGGAVGGQGPMLLLGAGNQNMMLLSLEQLLTQGAGVAK
ncbi:hypothetical protein GPECTOR_16g594 [Gonium pectorale]|uniref:SBP-type domain-containing protein n=1 Tax=Gonium pectorale TaxID=33097 RepID=A0A150GM71_GONPE|nr:hypothetical protein GPECTOR_16g594 [Gonium pectorale]|eukprot:KXZ50420.1 hypothetical protein GPECTOR_16g594 [Gonium pectorale]